MEEQIGHLLLPITPRSVNKLDLRAVGRANDDSRERARSELERVVK